MRTFDERLQQGRLGESRIARWFMLKRYSVLPAYEMEGGQFKGPRVFSLEGDLVSPDLLVFRPGKVFWIEAKSKAAFTWHRISQSYQDGIDVRHWNDYLALRGRMEWPLWLLFLHGPGQVAKDNPDGMVPPTGLFGREIGELPLLVDHTSDKWGRSGMVYWRASSLIRIASWEEVISATG